MEIFQFWLREALANIRRSAGMTALALLLSTLALFALGAFYLGFSNMGSATQNQTQRLELVVLLDSQLSPERRDQIVSAAQMPQVANIELVRASDALKEMGQQLQMPIEDLVATNPLRDELHLRVNDGADYEKVRDYLLSLPGVSGVSESASQEGGQHLVELGRWVQIALGAALVPLALSILLLISNAIRLTLLAQRRQIALMQLLGATPGFMRGPFLLEGMMYGVGGALLASGPLGLGYWSLTRLPNAIVRQILPLSAAQIFVPCVCWMLFAGLLGGLGGAFLAFGTHTKTLRDGTFS